MHYERYSIETEGENVQEFKIHFRTAKDMLEYHIGRDIKLTKYMIKMKDYNQKGKYKIDKCCKQPFQHSLHLISLKILIKQSTDCY